MIHSLALLGVLVAPVPQTQPAVDVPFELIQNHIYVDTKVNGKPVRMLLETGSPISFVSERIAPELGVKPGAPVQLNGGGANTQEAHLTQLGTLEVGGKTFKDVRALMTSFTDLTRRSSSRYDGLLANDITSQFVMDIDYPARRLRLWDPKSFEYRGTGAKLAATYNGHYLFDATIVLGGKSIQSKFTLDTGANTSISLGSRFCQANGLPGSVKTIDPPTNSAGIGGTVKSVLGRADSWSAGDQKYDAPLVTFSKDTAGYFGTIEHAGLVGNKLMSHYRVIVDKGRSQVIFELKDREAMYGDSSGMLIGQGDKGIAVVEGVLAGGPADEAGIRKGDEIAAFDGKPVEIPALRTRLLEPGKSFVLTISRGGSRRDVTVKTRKLI